MDQAELIAVIEKAARQLAEVLDLSHEGITQLPEQIGQLVDLRELHLHENQLSTLPEQIGQLANLEAIFLDGNRLERLPRSIRDQFDAIHATIPRLALDEQVPLPEHPDVRVPYSKLLLLERDGLPVDHVEVDGDLVEVQVNDLLEGIRHPAGLDVFISYCHQDAKSQPRDEVDLPEAGGG